MKFAQFQRAVHATEPRGVVIFTAPFVDIMPLLASQAVGLNAPLSVYARGRLIESSGNLDPDVMAKAEALGVLDEASPGSPNHVDFVKLVTDQLNAGGWLVLPDLTSIDVMVWREIAKILLLATPSDTNYMSRRHFRLFTFVTQGISLTQALPPLICQYAFVVDNSGAVKTRSQLGPIFDGTTTMQGYRALADFSKADVEVQQNGYVQLLLASMKHSKHDSEEKKLAPATEPTYVNEVVFRLREELLVEQVDLIEASEELDRIADEAFEKDVERQREQLGDDYDEQKDRHEHESRTTHVDKLGQSHEWAYGKVLQWVIAQCPDADLSVVPTIPSSDLSQLDVLWSRDDEETYVASWSGCECLIKRPLTSLRPEAAESIRRRFEAEAGRHAPLRHPHVVSLFGTVQDLKHRAEAMVIEGSTGSLEQRLISARMDSLRWTVADFIDMAIDVCRGMTYLATVIIHRDVSMRSVLCCKGTYKIGQFGCAVPLNYVQAEIKRGMVPLRWTAPEGFSGAFSPASDVWSFGILLWCALQYATVQPYADESYVPDAIVRGDIPACPKQCPDFLYDVIESCLAFNVDQRPSMTHVMIDLQHMKRSLPSSILNSEIPFPGDRRSFDEHNSGRKGPTTPPEEGRLPPPGAL